MNGIRVSTYEERKPCPTEKYIFFAPSRETKKSVVPEVLTEALKGVGPVVVIPQCSKNVKET